MSSLVTLKKHDARNRNVIYKLYGDFCPAPADGEIPSITTGVRNLIEVASKHPHPQNWKGWLTLHVHTDCMIPEADRRALAEALATRLGTKVHACDKVYMPENEKGFEFLCLNEDPKTGRALRIGKGELRELQETAVQWLREHGYEPQRVQKTVHELAAEKAELEADVDRLRTEATETCAAIQDMQNTAQETHAAVGVYEAALKTGKPRPRIPEPALRQAREYAREHAPEHRGMGLVGRLLEREDSMELLGCMAIIAPAMLTAVVVSALAVTVYKAKRDGDRSRTVGASPTPPAEKENGISGREGLETMLTEMMEQVREAVRAVEGLNRRMDTMEQQQREEDVSPVVMRVREGDWAAEMRENGRIYVRENEKIVGEARIPTEPRPTKTEATSALTSALRQRRRMRETPAVPAPADGTVLAPEIQR